MATAILLYQGTGYDIALISKTFQSVKIFCKISHIFHNEVNINIRKCWRLLYALQQPRNMEEQFS